MQRYASSCNGLFYNAAVYAATVCKIMQGYVLCKIMQRYVYHATVCISCNGMYSNLMQQNLKHNATCTFILLYSFPKHLQEDL